MPNPDLGYEDNDSNTPIWVIAIVVTLMIVGGIVTFYNAKHGDKCSNAVYDSTGEVINDQCASGFTNGTSGGGGGGGGGSSR